MHNKSAQQYMTACLTSSDACATACPNLFRKKVAHLAACIAAKASSEDATGKRDRKTGYAPGEWDITKMAPKLKGQA